MRRIALALVLVAVSSLAAGCGDAHLRSFRVPSSAMEPTVHCAKPGPGCLGTADDHVLVQPGKPVKRGDIIVFQTPPRAVGACGAGGIFLKRLVGLPGEQVKEDKAGFLLIRLPGSNAWQKLDEPYISALARREDRETSPEDINRVWSVPRGDYFVVGDNRSESCDSRRWGSVPRRNIIGPVVKISRG